MGDIEAAGRASILIEFYYIRDQDQEWGENPCTQ